MKEEWPASSSALIRPGVRVKVGPRTCTTNFVFQSPDNSTLFIGTAAHCVVDVELGGPAILADGRATGTVAYAGWWNGSGYDSQYGMDFALIRVDPEFRADVHPAVFHFAGPTGLADWTGNEGSALGEGDRVLWYGNSSVTEPVLPQANEGYICLYTSTEFWFLPVTQAWWGDSGSAVMSDDGLALGVLTNGFPLCGFAAGAFRLGPALDEARERGMDVRLVTWRQFGAGHLPDLP